MKVAVVGTGRIAEEHLQFIRAAADLDLVAVCDLSPTLAAFFAGDDARPFADHRAMLDAVAPDVVHVLTPAATHETIATDALRAGAHVIVEKPVALEAPGLERLLTIADGAGRHLVENHNYRFNEPVLQLRRLVEDGAIGELREVDVRLSLVLAEGRYGDPHVPHPSHGLPGGVVHEFVTHLTYLALGLLPGTPEVVNAAWRKRTDLPSFRYDDFAASFRVGPALANLRFDGCTRPEAFTLSARGTTGSVWTELFRPFVQVETTNAGLGPFGGVVSQFRAGSALRRAARRNLVGKVLGWTPYEGLQRFLTQTYDAFRDGGNPPVGPADMRRVVHVIDAMLERRDAA